MGCPVTTPTDRRPAASAGDLPEGWSVESAHGFGPFTTWVRFRRPDGTTVLWQSRDRRKGLDRPGVPSRTWWIAALFCVGSACFTVGPMPWWESLVGSRWTGLTFFVGSIFFTFASYLCFVEVANTPAAVDVDGAPRRHGPFRLVSWRPRSIDWWSTGVQLVGTIWFNAMTFLALSDSWSVQQTNRLVWAPDVIGSVCFLVASYLAWAEVCHSAGRLRFGDVSWWIVVLNLLGSVFFGLSAIGAFTSPSSGEVVGLRLDNGGTILGGICFFIASVLLVPEARSVRSTSPSRHV